MIWRSILLVSLAALLGLSAGAHASPAPGSVMTYRVHHEDHGDLGRHRLTFTQAGEDLVVEVDSEIAVEFLLFTAFRYTAKRREVWRDGRLIAYESETNDDGTAIRVRAEMRDEGLAIEGPEGMRWAAPGIFPTHPWNRAIVEAEVLMDTTNGDLLDVTITEAGKETITIEGREVETTKYQVSGDYEREVWYDRHGAWVRLRFYKFGDAVTYTLQTEIDPAGNLVRR